MTLPQKLQMYIDAELHDSALYYELSKMTNNEEYRQLLIEFSEDEYEHAQDFKRVYRSITGRSYNPPVSPVNLNGTFEDILRERILDESGDYRKYGEQYIMTDKNDMLKNTYYKARTDENVHALRIIYMLLG